MSSVQQGDLALFERIEQGLTTDRIREAIGQIVI
jgi:hypothetical protein